MGKAPKALLLEGIHPVAKAKMEEKGFEVELISDSLGESELAKTLKDYSYLGLRSKTKVTKKVFSENPQLEGVGCFCIGTDQVDLNTAKSLGVPVFNSPYSNTRSVAELVLCEIVALSRHLGDINTLAHQGTWKKSAKDNHEVRGKTLGIIGYGHIGSQVSILAEAFGLNVIYFDIVKKLPLGNATPCESMDEVLSTSDFVTLHVPDTSETRELIKEPEISKMKKGSYLLNLSRGKVVAIPALKSAIESGQLRGAAVDVYPAEPKSNDEKFESELQGLSNLILTPHIGGSTEEAQESIGIEVSSAMSGFLETGSTGGSVNFPALAVSRPKGRHRLINVHKNVPGVLSDINSIVSSSGVNILSQQLSTDPDIGYLIMDMDEGEPDQISDQVQKLDASIRTRVIYP